MSSNILLLIKITLLFLASLLAFLAVYLQYVGNPLSSTIENLVLQLGPLFDLVSKSELGAPSLVHP